MKILRFATLLAVIVASMTSCNFKDDWYSEPTVDMFVLSICVRDSAGKNLVAPLGEEYYNSDPNRTKYRNEVDPAKYSLTVSLAGQYESYQASFLSVKFDDDYKMCPQRESDWKYDVDGNWYLVSQLSKASEQNQAVYEPITYIVRCSAVFGDDKEHKIEAWWKEDKDRAVTSGKYFECTKATFDGNPITPVKGVTHYDNSESRDFVGYFLNIVRGVVLE